MNRRPVVIGFLLAALAAVLTQPGCSGPGADLREAGVSSAIKADLLGSSRSWLGHRFRQTLVGAQAACAVVLLVASALLARSLALAAGFDFGFDPNRIFNVDIGNATNGNVWALFVHPEHEGRGYGRQLHDMMVAWLWSAGLGRLWLTTEPGTRAQRFYEKAGWQLTDTTKGGELRYELQRRSGS